MLDEPRRDGDPVRGPSDAAREPGLHPLMELSRPAHTFIVRVTSADPGGVAGTVERVRTGERHRFRGADALASLIARLAAPARPDPSPGEVGTGQ
jgi:hypothetical protein